MQYGRHPHQGWFNQWGEEDARMVRSACERMQLESIWQQSAASLSGGQAQRAWLAMILAQDSDMVLLDEPTSALDIGHQTEVMEAIHRITAEGKTVLLVIHDLAMAARYCDELIAIGEGTIAAMGPGPGGGDQGSNRPALPDQCRHSACPRRRGRPLSCPVATNMAAPCVRRVESYGPALWAHRVYSRGRLSGPCNDEGVR